MNRNSCEFTFIASRVIRVNRNGRAIVVSDRLYYIPRNKDLQQRRTVFCTVNELIGHSHIAGPSTNKSLCPEVVPASRRCSAFMRRSRAQQANYSRWEGDCVRTGDCKCTKASRSLCRQSILRQILHFTLKHKTVNPAVAFTAYKLIFVCLEQDWFNTAVLS